MNNRNLHKRSLAVHAGTRRSQYGEMAEAMFMTQGFVYDTAEQAQARFEKVGEDEFIYARYGNPTNRMFEDRIAALEGSEDAFATTSGMAAVNGALMAVCQSGSHIVAARALARFYRSRTQAEWGWSAGMSRCAPASVTN